MSSSEDENEVRNGDETPQYSRSKSGSQSPVSEDGGQSNSSSSNSSQNENAIEEEMATDQQDEDKTSDQNSNQGDEEKDNSTACETQKLLDFNAFINNFMSQNKDKDKSKSKSHSKSRSRSRSRSKGSKSPKKRSHRSRSRSRSRTSHSHRRSRRSRTRSRSPRRSRSHRRSRSRSSTPVDGARLHVAELDVDTHKRDLEKVFERYGRLKEIWMARNPPCFAFVVYHRQRDADRAIRETDGMMVGHCRIKVTLARPRVRGGRFSRGYDPNLRCYQCGELGHFSRNCTDTKFGYKRPPTPPGSKWN